MSMMQKQKERQKKGNYRVMFPTKYKLAIAHCSHHQKNTIAARIFPTTILHGNLKVQRIGKITVATTLKIGYEKRRRKVDSQ